LALLSKGVVYDFAGGFPAQNRDLHQLKWQIAAITVE
jgi:hypothetical protein